MEHLTYLVPATLGLNCTATLLNAPGTSWKVVLGSNIILSPQWEEKACALLAYRSPLTTRSTVETLPSDAWMSTRCLDCTTTCHA